MVVFCQQIAQHPKTCLHSVWSCLAI